MKTAMQELIDWTEQYEGNMISANQVILKAYNLLEKEREQMVDFYTWMRINDTPRNAEQYFHYSDEDMLTDYLNQNK